MVVGVLDGNPAYDVVVASIDPAAVTAGGITLPAYVGVNSYINVYRGADGLGAIPVRVNAIFGGGALMPNSSAVEGPNGQLSVHRHGRHRLSDRKLEALTAVHDFHLRRADGTTAAERFFGRVHQMLCAQVLQRMPLPPPAVS